MSQRTLARREVQKDPKKPKKSGLRYWVREAVTTGVVLFLVALLLVGDMPESTLGLIVGGVALLAAIYLTAIPVAEESRSRRVAAGLYAFSAVWAVAAVWPYWTLLRPGDPVGRADLATVGSEQSLGKLAAGRYLLVAQVPSRALAGEATYYLKIRSNGAERTVRGTLVRPQRGATVAERHEVALDAGGPTRVKLESVRGDLTDAMTVLAYRRRVPHGVWLAVGLIVLVAAAFLDALFADRKRRSTITVGACFTVAFVEMARVSITPTSIRMPLLGAAIAAIFIAAVGGYLLNSAVRAVAFRRRSRQRAG